MRAITSATCCRMRMGLGHDRAPPALSPAVDRTGAGVDGAEPVHGARHDPAGRRARRRPRTGLWRTSAAEGARAQPVGGVAPVRTGGRRHHALEPCRGAADPGRQARGQFRLRVDSAGPHRSPWPGGAGVHHHFDAGHGLGQLRRARRRAADPRARPGQRGHLDRDDPAPLRIPAVGDLRMSQAFLASAIVAAQVLLLLAMGFSIVRMVRGPRAQDRALALDTFYVNAMILLLTIGIRTGSPMYFEAALIIALLGFASTMAVSKFLMRGEVIE